MRQRLSAEYKPPRTDEDLAKRFEKNHEEHERRWARGSFLRTLQGRVERLASGCVMHSRWSAWLSLNPENDGTAIWLEQKFNVPASGQWKNESIFQIPIKLPSVKNSDSIFPGLIVFECTPLEEVKDDLERKFRILEDCTRLRDVIQALPPKRHYMPSLLTISWSESEQSNSLSDLAEMISTMLQEGVLHAHYKLSLSAVTKDLDSKLGEAIGLLSLDVSGKYVLGMSSTELFASLQLSPQNFALKWLDQCLIDEEFNWNLHGQMLEMFVDYLNRTSQARLDLSAEGPKIDGLPPLNLRHISDSRQTFDSIEDWLQLPLIREVANEILEDVKSHRDMGREFPSRSFIPQLCDLAQDHVGRMLKIKPTEVHCIQKAQYAAVLDAVKEWGLSYEEKLHAMYTIRLRRSPKRRSSFGTSIASRSSTPTKRRRISLSEVSTIGDDDTLGVNVTPSYASLPLSAATSPAPSEDLSTPVTVAMLRTLTKSVKAKYSGSPLAKN
ncbi:hypothetical protein SERLADRAFT_471836 [Serpula lacrymans var. lacrymans S7.9]|nr:uncharacterized protein SERLADRAFT_471836 [Serpula lacrymans var. lacrymans S7.9]EGO23106.1 hypothetical protein SERLADRAFT_471836 [Serpula lacrymans var. lacrymans S7.9]